MFAKLSTLADDRQSPDAGTLFLVHLRTTRRPTEIPSFWAREPRRIGTPSAGRDRDSLRLAADQRELEFELLPDPDYYGVATTVVNPALVVEGWGRVPVEAFVDGKRVEPSKDSRVGDEPTPTGVRLVAWFQMTSAEPVRIVLRRADAR